MHTEIEPHAIEVLQRRKDEIEIELIDLYSSFSISQRVLYNPRTSPRPRPRGTGSPWSISELQDERVRVEASLVYFMGRCRT